MFKRAFLFLSITILLAAGAGWFALPGLVEKRLHIAMGEDHFPDMAIESIQPTLTGVTLSNITFDEDGFSTIEKANINFNWFLYLLKQNIDSIYISNVVHHDLSDTMNLDEIKKWFKTSQIRSIPINKLSIDPAQLNLSTEFGDIRIEAKSLLTTLEDGSKSIQSVAWSRQYQLGFEIPVSGLIRPDNSFLLESTFNEGKLNLGPLRTSRLSGWASAEGQDDTLTTFSTQLDAGSADILGLPLQDLSLALSQSPNGSNGIFRSKVSGMPSIKMSGDWNQNEQATTGTIFVEMNDPEDVRSLITTLMPDFDLKTIKTLDSAPTLLTLEYLPDRRFAGGPIPFDFTLTTKDQSEKFIEGNILIYPDSMDVKGSLFGQDDAVSDLLKLASHNKTYIEDKTIRIDFNLKDWLETHMNDDQG
ncbi:MAG: hypothetical protein AAF569_03440 [Pseudomonadota bacterium]